MVSELGMSGYCIEVLFNTHKNGVFNIDVSDFFHTFQDLHLVFTNIQPGRVILSCTKCKENWADRLYLYCNDDLTVVQSRLSTAGILLCIVAGTNPTLQYFDVRSPVKSYSQVLINYKSTPFYLHHFIHCFQSHTFSYYSLLAPNIHNKSYILKQCGACFTDKINLL